MRPPIISTTLQEAGFFPTLVYFYLWAVKGLFGLFLACFMAVKGLFGLFLAYFMAVKGLFGQFLAGFMTLLWLVCG